MADWNARWIGLAAFIRCFSLDPSTRVGSCIVGERQRVLSLGWNGFPRKVEDRPERYEDRVVKLSLIQHAERNAFDNSECSLVGATLYCTLMPCTDCTKSIIQKGIRRVVACGPDAGQFRRWEASFHAATGMLAEAEVDLDVLPPIDEYLGTLYRGVPHILDFAFGVQAGRLFTDRTWTSLALKPPRRSAGTSP